MMLNEDAFYTKVIDPNEIYKFIVLFFSFEITKILKNIGAYTR
jgi:hypothetical protein